MAAPWVRARQAGWPVASSVLVGVVQLVGSRAAAGHQLADRLPLDAFGYLLLVAGPVLLLFRRRRPVPVVVGTALVTMAYLAGGYAYGPAFLSFAVAYCVAVATGHRTAAWLSLGAVYLGHLLVSVVLPAGWLRGARPHGGWWQELGVTALALLLARSPSWPASGASRSRRTGPPPRRRPGERPTRSGCGWPGSCTTSWPTASR